MIDRYSRCVGSSRVAPKQLRRAEHAVHRRAQLVGDDAQEVRLGLAGGVGLVARGFKLLDQVGLMLLEGA